MIPLELQIVIALTLDFLLGDPRWLPHPVKLIGRGALFLEAPFRRLFRRPRIAGFAMVGFTVTAAAAASWLVLKTAGEIHPIAEDFVSISILYTTFALRDMTAHSLAVYRELERGELRGARVRVGMIVGRDTDRLEEQEVVRAAVESVAENTGDGITAPLLFGVAFGPVGAVAYKAINTLDSTFGYKNERYLRFGFASAKADDLANYLPARITGLFIVLAAAVLGMDARRSLAVYLRDRRAHPSPNGGHSEAAMAGALGVQLGGVSSYSGKVSARPTIGDPLLPLSPRHILFANRLLITTTLLVAAMSVGLRHCGSILF